MLRPRLRTSRGPALLVLLAAALVATAGRLAAPAPARADGAGGTDAGHAFVLHVDHTGDLWAWGANGAGQLGLGTSGGSVLTPTRVPGMSNVLQVAAGDSHGVALRTDGTVWTWGRGDLGQLGLGSTANRTSPQQVPGLTNVVAVAAGTNHTLALRADGTVWAWGYNANGQLGVGDTTNRLAPVQVPGLAGVTGIAAGGHHSLALLGDGTLRAWGWNFYGQLGVGDTANRLSPTAVPGLSGVQSVTAWVYHSLAIMADGTVRAWGRNHAGQLGDNTTTNRTSPVTVSGLTGVVQLSAGFEHSLALRADGTVWAWGSNGNGQLGLGTVGGIQKVPVQVTGISGVDRISAGAYFSLAVTVDGEQETVAAWGANDAGQLGDGTTSPKSSPTGTTGDFTPPAVTWIGYNYTPPHFSPNGDGVRDTIVVAYSLSEPAAVTATVVVAATGQPVRTLAAGSQSGTVQLIWNGLRDDGSAAPEGWYAVTVAAVDAAGNDSTSTIPVELFLDLTPPALGTPVLSAPAFSPNGDGVQDVLDLLIPVPESAFYTVAVRDAGGAAVRTFLADSHEFRDIALAWGGLTDAGGAAPDGLYTLRIAARDLAGNVAQRTAAVTVDRVPPSVTVAAWSPAAIVQGGGQAATAYTLDGPATVARAIVNGASQTVRTFPTAAHAAGTFSLTWDGTDGSGNAVPPGGYRLRVTATDAAGNAATTLGPELAVLAPPPPSSTCGGGTAACGTVALAAGPLLLDAPAAVVWDVALAGFDRAVPAALPLTVVDATGSGAGWHVTAAATPFTRSDGLPLAGALLTLNGSGADADAAGAPPVLCDTGSTCTLPALGGPYPVTVPLGAAGAKVLSAGTGSGLGAATSTAWLWLRVPAAARAGTYTTVLTFNLGAGP